jgi:hypothetical protein
MHQPSLRNAGSRAPGKTYRGSRKRLRRIKWRDHTPAGLWIFLMIILLVLFVGFLSVNLHGD